MGVNDARAFVLQYAIVVLTRLNKLSFDITGLTINSINITRLAIHITITGGHS